MQELWKFLDVLIADEKNVKGKVFVIVKFSGNIW